MNHLNLKGYYLLYYTIFSLFGIGTFCFKSYAFNEGEAIIGVADKMNPRYQ